MANDGTKGNGWMRENNQRPAAAERNLTRLPVPSSYNGNVNGRSNIWLRVSHFLAGVVVALSGAWASGLETRANNQADITAQIRQLVKAQEAEEQEIKELTAANWSNQQAIAVLTQRYNDLFYRIKH